MEERNKANTQAELANWLINAFNGVWLRTAHPQPKEFDAAIEKEKRAVAKRGAYEVLKRFDLREYEHMASSGNIGPW